MNKTILKGNLGNDPDVKIFESGQKVCKFSLATSESYPDKKGEKIIDTEWHNIVFWGKIVDVIEKFVHKGDQLLVEGKNKTRSYEDKNGSTHYITEVICHIFEFCGSKERVESKPYNQEGEWQKGEKRTVPAMSNVDDLPDNVTTYDENDQPF